MSEDKVKLCSLLDYEEQGKMLDKDRVKILMLLREMEKGKEEFPRQFINPIHQQIEAKLKRAKVNFSRFAVGFCCLMCNDRTHGLMWAYVIYTLSLDDPKQVTLDRLCDSFPNGFPANSAVDHCWEQQEGWRHGDAGIDNMLDEKSVWGIEE